MQMKNLDLNYILPILRSIYNIHQWHKRREVKRYFFSVMVENASSVCFYICLTHDNITVQHTTA